MSRFKSAYFLFALKFALSSFKNDRKERPEAVPRGGFLIILNFLYIPAAVLLILQASAPKHEHKPTL